MKNRILWIIFALLAINYSDTYAVTLYCNLDIDIFRDGKYRTIIRDQSRIWNISESEGWEITEKTFEHKYIMSGKLIKIDRESGYLDPPRFKLEGESIVVGYCRSEEEIKSRQRF